MDDKDFQKIEEMIQRSMQHQSEVFQGYVGSLAEDFQVKFDIVVEGHQLLNDKIDRLDNRVGGVENRLVGVENRLTNVENKVDTISTDLKAHRNDTEARHGIYQVKEN